MAEKRKTGVSTTGEPINVDEKEDTEEQGVKSGRQHSGRALDRYMNAPAAVQFSFLLQCSWAAAAVTFQFSLINGGPASMVYGSIFAGLGTTLVSLSLAEMASMDPTVGAQYRWSAAFAPKWNRFFGLMQGWVTVFAWICTCASNPAIISNIILNLASWNNPGYVSKRWHATLLMWALTVFPCVANFWLPSFINVIETAGATCQVVFFLVNIVLLAVRAEKSSSQYVFQTLTHGVSGWQNPAVAWSLGLLTVTFPLTGFDGIIHMSDEVRQARLRVPRSMVFSVISNATMQFLFLLTVLFTIGDLDRISSSPLPIIEVYHQATGSRAATNLLMTMLILIAFVAFFNIIASVSRLILAFSRDSGLPFSPVFAKVHVTLGVPVNALLLVASCLCILALINIGSSVAFNAFISLPALGLYISYFFPIFFLFWRRVSRKGMENIHWGPFRLGDKVGPLVNAAAMCYIVFIVIWLPFPAMLPVDRLNMNYSGPILGAVMLLGAFDWCVSGRKRFGVPAGGVQGLGGSI